MIQRAGYAKDLSKINRDLRRVVLLDNSPTAYSMQKENAIPALPWYDDKNDDFLLKLTPFLRKVASSQGDIRPLLAKVVVDDRMDFTKVRDILYPSVPRVTRLN